jgi:hypothetical protein
MLKKAKNENRNCRIRLVFWDIFLLLLKESQNPTYKARFKMQLTMIRQIIQTRNLVACSFFYSSVVAASSASESTLTIAPEATPPPTPHNAPDTWDTSSLFNSISSLIVLNKPYLLQLRLGATYAKAELILTTLNI